MEYTVFFDFLKKTEKSFSEFIIQNFDEIRIYCPEVIEKSVLSYILRGGKRLRPAVVLMACGAVGGDIETALPVAVATELFHTWTLVHDDIIDNDELRRGYPTIHIEAKEYAKEKLKFNSVQAEKYGQDIAILTGDVQHGWSISLLTNGKIQKKVQPDVIFKIISRLQTFVLCTLVHGEVKDVEFSMKGDWFLDISEEDILNMLWMKTGVLYEFSAMAGAMIGKNSSDMEDQEIDALIKFCGNCGTAFQLRDDILGILGDEKDLGKPVGSDIREGKKTTIIRTALINANKQEKEYISKILGNSSASFEELERVKKMLIELGGIQHTYDLAKSYIDKSLPFLDVIKSSKYKSLLEQWAYFLIERNY